ncbi:peroxidase 5-like [Tripterygium wilfordii]|nr:peroxidase 5-like [Tripterygium wilfordii]XP_038697622.1 peroxidase 5-like [Tripterygium wilfordii]
MARKLIFTSHLSAACASMLIMLMLLSLTCEATLSTKFYDKKCPDALTTIRKSVRTAIAKERRMAASLIRLHFHDCFVQGCDASILLDETHSIKSEKTALPNNASVRGYEIIDNAKAAVEKICPGVVSCADIVTVAARDSSEYVGGPSWKVKLGRRDSTTASRSLAESGELPSFTASLDQLITHFARKGLDKRDLVALSGSHTIGQAQCFTFRNRIYNKTSDIDAGFANTRKGRCPKNSGSDKLSPLDLVTPNSFDNNYFKNLIQKKGLLHSDQVLFSGGSTDKIVYEYSKNPSLFNSDFASAMIKMGNIDVLTGSSGEIRRICSAVN